MKALRTRHVPGCLTPRQVEAQYGVSAIRIRKLLVNHPNYLDGIVRIPHGGRSLHTYHIPESEVSKLFFLKGKQKK
jgi:hypothetical protein